MIDRAQDGRCFALTPPEKCLGIMCRESMMPKYPPPLFFGGRGVISSFTPAGMQVVAKRSGFNIVAGAIYTVRGFVLNRHWRTREPDHHVLLEEVTFPDGRIGPIGFPRDVFDYPATIDQPARELVAA